MHHYNLKVDYRTLNDHWHEEYVVANVFTNAGRTEQETLTAARKFQSELRRYHNNVRIMHGGREVS